MDQANFVIIMYKQISNTTTILFQGKKIKSSFFFQFVTQFEKIT